MGNQSSAPESPPPITEFVAPPCDTGCQRQKQLTGLKLALDSTQAGTEEHEQARIAYYTLLEGQEWLVKEKARIAKEEIKPVAERYSSEYNELLQQQKSQKIFTDLSSALKAQLTDQDEENNFLKKQFGSVKETTSALNRTFQLGENTNLGIDWISYLLWAIIGVVGLYVLYLIFIKVSMRVSTPAVGGIRI